MNPPIEVHFEQTADTSLEACEHFMIDELEIPIDRVQAFSLNLISTTLKRLSQRPGTYTLCRLVLELGISDYRELLIDHYRVIYRYWPEDNRVSVYLFAHQRQDFKQLLFEYQLLN